MEFSMKGPDPPSQPPGKTNMALKCFKSPQMNFKVNLLFHLYETPFTHLGIPTLIVQRVSGGGGVVG